jgi:hypothetical protein
LATITAFGTRMQWSQQARLNQTKLRPNQTKPNQVNDSGLLIKQAALSGLVWIACQAFLIFYDDNWKDKHEGDQADEHITAPANLQPPQPLRDPTPFEQFLAPPAYYNREPEALIDEYKEYNRTKPAPAPNALHWWRDHAQKWPNMAQMAFDLLSIPAMSAECERVFSQTKLLITGQRNRLGDRVIEAVECLKHWYKASAFE